MKMVTKKIGKDKRMFSYCRISQPIPTTGRSTANLVC